MALLAYWTYKNYLSDTEEGFDFNFNSNQPRLHDEVEVGDDVFLVTGARTEHGFEMYLVGHLIVSAKTFNAPDYKYGRYRLWGDERTSRYFRIDGPALTSALAKFSSIQHFERPESHKYAQSFQTLRKLPSSDAALLRQFTRTLVVHPTTHYRFPEREFEESLSNDDRIQNLVQQQGAIPEAARGRYIRRVARNRSLIRELNELYAGRCQLCSFDPLVYYGKPLCAAHHIVYISRGGADELGNLLLSCPNCHEAIHKCGAAFDYRGLTYAFENGRKTPLVINKHLQAA